MLYYRVTQNSKVSEESKIKTLKELEYEIETLKALRLKVAKKNRAISLLQRQLDEIPSRAELAQYQRRFLELYNQGKCYLILTLSQGKLVLRFSVRMLSPPFYQQTWFCSDSYFYFLIYLKLIFEYTLL